MSQPKQRTTATLLSPGFLKRKTSETTGEEITAAKEARAAQEKQQLVHEMDELELATVSALRKCEEQRQQTDKQVQSLRQEVEWLRSNYGAAAEAPAETSVAAVLGQRSARAMKSTRSPPVYG